MLSCLFTISLRQKLSQGRPADLTRLRSDMAPLERAPRVARESLRTVSFNAAGHALITTDAAAISGMKLLPSDLTAMPPDQIGLFLLSVRAIPTPEFPERPLGSVEPSVYATTSSSGFSSHISCRTFLMSR